LALLQRRAFCHGGAASPPTVSSPRGVHAALDGDWLDAHGGGDVSGFMTPSASTVGTATGTSPGLAVRPSSGVPVPWQVLEDERRVQEQLAAADPHHLPPLSAADRASCLDLRPYVHTFAHTVHARAPVSRAFLLFRTLGLRHLPVVTDTHDVVGIIMRRELTADALKRSYAAKQRRGGVV
jgi:hypothetical protein